MISSFDPALRPRKSDDHCVVRVTFDARVDDKEMIFRV